ncbi:hypothetical protein IFM89_035691 [Coptis chinensis]|uniref:Protein kinase domain-containing protein n=1 Tax=Coptis chinensis TaxID=261450 RepID=A0A835MGL3_9MAGN|nr:hypothetical protein IFM89_035691 [Coptis chinensis]
MNNFTGDIPKGFGWFLPKLQNLKLFSNLLNGTIPSFLANLTELTSFELAYNVFTPSQLFPEIGNMSKLENIWLPCTNLVGKIPDSIGQLESLKNLDLTFNSLSGEIPVSIGNLKKLVQLIIYDNYISGELPVSLGNLVNLRYFDASQNNLTGKLPEKFAGLQLISLNLNDNQLEGEIPESLVSNRNLEELKLFNNKFTGTLPASLGLNSNLDHFDVSSNNFVGQFPSFLCSGKKLTRLITFDNRFSGNLLENYGKCDSLYYVRIFNNELSGEIPISLWSHPRISHFEITNNNFNGLIHSSISKARNISKLLISGNHFTGALPPGLCGLPLLAVIDASGNQFSGYLPKCMSEMKNLQSLRLQENKFYGEIPSRVSSWSALAELNLSGNKFSGEIPTELGSLPVLNYLDLSRNIFSGEIPSELVNLKLNIFNLSFNNLEGKIPLGFSNSLYVSSFVGNQGLCSPDLKPFPPCPETKSSTWILVVVVICLSFVVLVSGFCFVKKKTRTIGGKTWKLTSFHRVGFNEEEIFSALTDKNLVGSGGSGSVYKARLKTGQTVAVKRIWVGKKKPETDSAFQSEVEILGTIRHGNIVKLLFSCVGEEYAYTVKITEKSDVYSFGVVLLELVTGKKPIDPSFEENNDIVKWVTGAAIAPEEHGSGGKGSNLEHLMDQKLNPSCYDYEQMEKVLNVALLCTSALPLNRPSMRRVVELLKDWRHITFPATDQ